MKRDYIVARVPRGFEKYYSDAELQFRRSSPVVDIDGPVVHNLNKWGAQVTAGHGSLTVIRGHNGVRLTGPMTFILRGQTSDRDGDGDLFVLLIPIRKEPNGITKRTQSRSAPSEPRRGSIFGGSVGRGINQTRRREAERTSVETAATAAASGFGWVRGQPNRTVAGSEGSIDKYEPESGNEPEPADPFTPDWRSKWERNSST